MIGTLLLLIVANPFQDKVEKFKPKNVPAETIYTQIKQMNLPGIKRIAYDPTDNSFIAQGTIEAIEELRALIEKFDTVLATESASIQHNAASYIAWVLKGADSGGRGFLPEGVEANVDKATNAVVVKGPPEAVREIVQLIAQLDVKPTELHVSCVARLPILGRSIESTGTVQSGSTWTHSERTSATTIKVMPLLNKDGSVTLIFVGGPLDTSVSFQLSTKPTERTLVYFAPRFRFSAGKNEPEPVVLFKSSASQEEADAFLEGMAMPGNGWRPLDTKGDLSNAPQFEARFVFTVDKP